MKNIWLRKGESDKLILFYNGWGMDHAAVEHLDSSGYDVLVVYDYTDNLTLEADISAYQEYYLVAWSLGVWAVGESLISKNIKFEKCIAINGTPKPVDDELGIPLQIFKGTLENWDTKNRVRFLMRIAGNRKDYQNNISRFGQRETTDQKAELAAIYEKIKNNSSAPPFSFDLAIIGENDAIYTADNQNNYWKPQTKSVSLTIPHYPFFYFCTWKQILGQ